MSQNIKLTPNSLPFHHWVVDFAVSPDGRLLAAGLGDGTFQLLELPGGKRLLEDREAEPIHRVCFSERGDRVAAFGRQDGMRLFDTRLATRIARSQGRILGVVWDLAGRVTVDLTRHLDGSGEAFSVHEPGNARPLFEWRHDGHPDSFFPYHGLSPTGRFVGGITDHRLQVWEVESGRLLELGSGMNAGDACFSPDGRHLASWGYSQEVHVVDLVSGESVTLTGIPGRPCILLAAAFDPTGRYLAGHTLDGHVAWDVQARRLLFSSSSIPEGNRREGFSDLLFSRDGSHVAFHRYDGWIAAWCLATGKEALRLQVGRTPQLELSPVAPLLAVCEREPGRLTIFDLRSGDCILEKVVEGPDLRFLPDGRRVLLRERNLLHLLDLEEPASTAGQNDHRAAVRDIRCIPGSDLAASVSTDGAAHLWNLLASAHERSLPPVPVRPGTIGASDDGRSVLISGKDPGGEHLIFVSGIDADEVSNPYHGLSRMPAILAMDRSNRWLAAGEPGTPSSADPTQVEQPARVVVWSRDSSRPSCVHLLDEIRCPAVAFSPDGAWLAIGSTRILVTPSGGTRHLALFDGPGARAEILRFDEEGRALTAVTRNGFLETWDLDPRTMLGFILRIDVRSRRRYRIRGERILHIGLSHDQKYLVTIESDEVLRLREAATGKVIRSRRTNVEGVESLEFAAQDRVLVLGRASGDLEVVPIDQLSPADG